MSAPGRVSSPVCVKCGAPIRVEVDLHLCDRCESGRVQACGRRSRPGDVIGAACPDCGHTNLLHPGPSNPALSACIVCELAALVAPASRRVNSTYESPTEIHRSTSGRVQS